METYIKEKELPLKELEQLGVYKEGGLTLPGSDIAALLAGRRTDLCKLTDLEMEGFQISHLEAKLSLSRDREGKIKLNIHPIYQEAQQHPLLDDKEAKELMSGKVDSVKKLVEHNGMEQKLLIEFDKETKEFISYYPYQVEVPFKVNGETLDHKQKKAFQNGEVIELKDGTRLKHSATDSKGVRSDTKRLIFSVLFDGGLSYLVMRGLKNLAEKGELQKEGYTQGYNQALADMMGAKDHRIDKESTVGGYKNPDLDKQENRSYERGRAR